jgi:hypothetical protein
MRVNGDWSDQIQERYNAGRKGIGRRVRFPERGLQVSGDKNRVTLHWDAASVTANMQTDASAFEGWALVLMRWADVTKIVISWEDPRAHIQVDSKKIASRNGHYNRFLFRVDRFSEIFKDEVEIKERSRLDQTTLKAASNPTLNIGKGTASDAPTHREAKIESKIAKKGIKKFGVERLDRQLPVGLFDGKPSKKSAIFSGGKSAIDLVGVDKHGDLWIFELKADKNLKVGALSELFFYSALMRDVTAGRIRFCASRTGGRTELTPEQLASVKKIHACLLTPEAHPLIDEKLLKRFNTATKKAGWSVDYCLSDLPAY